MNIYVGSVLVIMSLLMLYNIVKVWLASVENNERELFLKGIYWQILFMVALVAFFVTANIFIGYLVNMTFRSHKYIISSYILLIRSQMQAERTALRALGENDDMQIAIPGIGLMLLFK